MPGFAPNNRFPRSARHRRIRPLLERAGVYARRADGEHGRRVAIMGRRRAPDAWPFHAHEDLRRQLTRPRAQLVARRRRGPDPRAPRHPDRGRAARQAQARLHPARGHGRLRDRGQRREDLGDGPEAPGEALLPPLGLPGRPEVAHAQRHARAPPRGGHPPRREGHAAEEPPRAEAADQAEGLRGSRAPAHRPAAQAARARDPLGAPTFMSEDKTQGNEPSEQEPTADEPVAQAPAAPEEQPAAEAEQPAAQAEQPAAEALEQDVDDDQEPAAPRQKPLIPGADLEVDIVREGEEALRGENLYGEYDEDGGDAGDGDEDLSQPIADASIDLAAGARYTATGKRKTAVARVILKPGDGTYSINGKPLDAFFPRPTLQRNIRQPLETVGYDTRMDVVAAMHGGGVSAQAGALRHGISRALIEADPNLRSELKRRGFLTRDARVKERKKAGLKKARKRPQFSKR